MNPKRMRALLGAIFCTCLFLALASPAFTAGSRHDDQKAKSVTVTGCLESSSAGAYTLTAQDGTKYVISGSDATLKDHVGHKVTIKGTMSSASESQASGTSTITVSSVKMISTSCS